MKHLLIGISLATLLGSHPAWAAEVTDLASAFQKGNPFDAHLSVGYQRILKRGAFKRELIGEPTDPNQAAIKRVKEGRFTHERHILNLRAEFGLWKHLQLHIALPIILADGRTFGFTQNGGDPCPSPQTLEHPNPKTEDNCVTPYNSTLVNDGFLDRDALLSNNTRVVDWGSNNPPQGGLFLPTRSGIDQLHLGISWAPIDQRDDDTKPTFVAGFEARFAVGSHMEYDPKKSNANKSVGRGIHELSWWISVSRRMGKYIDPWFSVYYTLPIAAGGSLFDKTDFPGSGQLRAGPRQKAGLNIGMEIVPWEQPKENHKVSIELSAVANAIFEGRGYSPIWEIFAGAEVLNGRCLRSANNPGGALLWDNGDYCRSENEVIPYPGITHIENFMNLGARLAVHVHLTKFIYGSLGLSLTHDTAHAVTFADAGRSLSPNGQIDLNDPAQVNPMYRPLIDAPGRRFRVEETTIFDMNINLTAQF
jgi:hypothetical protein